MKVLQAGVSLVFAIIGVGGVIACAGDAVWSSTGHNVLGSGVNLGHAGMLLIIAIAGGLLWRRPLWFWVLAACVYVPLAVWDPFVVNSVHDNYLAINTNDMLIDPLLAAVALLGIAKNGTRRSRSISLR